MYLEGGLLLESGGLPVINTIRYLGKGVKLIREGYTCLLWSAAV
ncbi:hypothetical protein DCCM_2970 [Desulfocucumis palustris]|uniref:Uncharacterized protein n=1 Tax=Desulfocucumis palustris TaxID=1898651 RepID=A0A2L2XC09_9FIRM|nr:hypothetical protein DCCM_2970 [Desulfocucumis palustris]